MSYRRPPNTVARLKKKALAAVLLIPVITALAIFRGEVFVGTVNWFLSRAIARTAVVAEPQ